jgi:hypothetical protein
LGDVFYGFVQEDDMEVYDEFYDYSAALPGPLLARATRGMKTAIDEEDEAWSEGSGDESYDETVDGTDVDDSERPRASISASGGVDSLIGCQQSCPVVSMLCFSLFP